MARGDSLVRQWNLLKVIQARHFGVSADELAESLKCSKRQVQRDLNLLANVGFPIRHETVDFGKRLWKLSPEFLVSDQFALSVTEMLSLSLCEQMLLPLAGTPFGQGLVSVLKKIRSLLPKSTLVHFQGLEKKLLVKNVPSYDYSHHSKEIGIFNQAITESRAVKIRYRSQSQPKPYDTCFHPYGLVVYSGDLYCIGFMEKYCEIRTLKLSRVLGVELMAKPFQPPKDFSLEGFLNGSFGIIAWGEPRPITVRLYSWAATAIREHQWHPSQKIVEDGEDSVTVKFELSDTTEFKRWVLGFGRNAVVLKPEELARDIAEELAAARTLYGTDTPASSAAHK